MSDNDFLVGQGVSDGRNFSFHLLKAENELFKAESYKPEMVVQIKRKETKKNGEEWFLLVDKKMELHFKSNRLNAAEKKVFRTVEGLKFLITAYKAGFTSVSKLKTKLKEIMEESD